MTEDKNVVSVLGDSAQVREALAKSWTRSAVGVGVIALLAIAFNQLTLAHLERVCLMWVEAQDWLSQHYVVPAVLIALTVMTKVEQARAAALLIPQVLAPAIDDLQVKAGHAQARKADKLDDWTGLAFDLSAVTALVGGFITIGLMLALKRPSPDFWPTAAHVAIFIGLACWRAEKTSMVMPQEIIYARTPEGKRFCQLLRQCPNDAAFVGRLTKLTQMRLSGVDLTQLYASGAGAEREDPRS